MDTVSSHTATGAGAFQQTAAMRVGPEFAEAACEAAAGQGPAPHGCTRIFASCKLSCFGH